MHDVRQVKNKDRIFLYRLNSNVFSSPVLLVFVQVKTIAVGVFTVLMIGQGFATAKLFSEIKIFKHLRHV
jgi:hypothetical protein